MVAGSDSQRDEWSSLYAEARRFRDQASWEWMSDDQVFAVVDPETNAIAYCCVLGMARQVFGLVAYLGSRGLDLHHRIQSGLLGPGDDHLVVEQDCLVVDFTDRDMLEKEDLKVIRDLGLRFRGRGAWPVFRSHRPNHAPWFLERQEVRFLTSILEQACDVCSRVKGNPDLLTPSREKLYFLRQREETEWRDTWREPEPYTPPPPPKLQVDEIRLFRTRQNAEHAMKEWQLDLLVLPSAIMDRERPYLARLLLCVDAESGFVLCAEAMDPWTYEETLLGALLAPMESHSAIPKRLAVRNEILKTQLEAPLEKIGVMVEVVDSLPALEEVKAGLLSSISGGIPEDW